MSKKLSDIPILYINLEKRTDRKEHMEQLLQNHTYERVDAVYHERGNIGCTLSHIKCLEIAKQREYNECIIFEDDILFEENTTLENIPYPEIDFEMFMLCVNVSESIEIDTDYSKIQRCSCTAGYLIKSSMYDILIDLYRECSNRALQHVDRKDFNIYCNLNKLNCDMCWNDLWNDHMAIVLKKQFIYPMDGYSDVTNSDRKFVKNDESWSINKECDKEYLQRLNKEFRIYNKKPPNHRFRR